MIQQISNESWTYHEFHETTSKPWTPHECLCKALTAHTFEMPPDTNAHANADTRYKKKSAPAAGFCYPVSAAYRDMLRQYADTPIRLRAIFRLMIFRLRIFESKFRSHCAKRLDVHEESPPPSSKNSFDSPPASIYYIYMYIYVYTYTSSKFEDS